MHKIQIEIPENLFRTIYDKVWGVFTDRLHIALSGIKSRPSFDPGETDYYIDDSISKRMEYVVRAAILAVFDALTEALQPQIDEKTKRYEADIIERFVKTTTPDDYYDLWVKKNIPFIEPYKVRPDKPGIIGMS